MEQYIGKEKVIVVVELREKTPLQNDMVEVLFENGTKEKMPKTRFELIVTPEVSEDSEVQKKINARVGAILYGSLHEYGVKWGEVNQVSDAMVKLCENGMEKASDILWGSGKPGITLNEINRILLENHAKQNNNGVGSTGSGLDSENKG